MSDLNIGGIRGPQGPSFEPTPSGKGKESIESWCQNTYENLSSSLSDISVTKEPIPYSKETASHAISSLNQALEGVRMDGGKAKANLQKLARSQSPGAPAILKSNEGPLTGSNLLTVNTSLSLALAQSGAGVPPTGEVVDPHSAARIYLLNKRDRGDSGLKNLFDDVHGTESNDKI